MNAISRQDRIPCIDRVRGGIVFAMIFFQLMERFDSLGFLSRIASHDNEYGIILFPGMALANIGAPLFFLLIAFNYIPSLHRRIEQDGRRAAYTHFIFRYLSILGFGCCIRTIELIFDGFSGWLLYLCLCGAVIAALSGLGLLLASLTKKDKLKALCGKIMRSVLVILGLINLTISTVELYHVFWLDTLPLKYWNVLQSIGAAGLLMLLFAESSTVIRGAAGAVLFGIFTFIHQLPGNMDRIDMDTQGGVIGVLGWCSMMLIFTVMADLFYRDRECRQQGKTGLAANSYLIGLVVLILLGFAGQAGFVVNMGSVSPGYILVSLPMCAFIFWLLTLLDNWQPKIPFLTWWGTSPIIMYLLQYFVHDVIPSVINGFDELPFLPALGYVLLCTAIITWIAYRLYRNQQTIKM